MTTTSTRKRTDIHRPSAIVPSEYDYFASDYIGPSDLDDAFDAERKDREKMIADNGWRESTHEHGGTCHVCGATASYISYFVHRPTGEYIITGEDCAHKLGLKDNGAFKTLRKRVKSAREYATGKKRAKITLEDLGMVAAWDWFVTDSEKDYDDIAISDKYPEWIARRHAANINILSDMIAKLIRYGSWSDRATAYAKSLWEKVEDWRATADEAVKRSELERESAADAPTGRVHVSGEVVSTKDIDTPYGITTKMLVKTSKGWKLWVSVPRAISGVERGERVAFTATVTPSDDDPKFAFGKRPSKALIISG
jgi:hypothetical protein